MHDHRARPDSTEPTTPLWLIDGYNVLRVSFSRATERATPREPAPPDASEDGGWWSAPRRRALVELASRACRPSRTAALAGATVSARDVWVVFDGPRSPEPPAAPERDPGSESPRDAARGPAGARVIYAASADDWIVRVVKECGARGQPVTVVTADRPLAGRSRHHGAEIGTPAEFVAHCLSLPPAPPRHELPDARR